MKKHLNFSAALKGDARRDGWTFQREFEHAQVFVDVERKSARNKGK